MLAVGGIVGLIVAFRAAPILLGWLRTPSIPLGQLRAIRRSADPVSPVKAYYEWREGQWTQLAKGAAALGVTLLVAVTGASLDSAKTVRETTHANASEKTTSTHVSVTASYAVGLGILAAWAVAIGAWREARYVDDGFLADAARVSRLPGPNQP